MRRSVRNYSTFSIRPLGSLLTIFGIAELFLAAVGLYGVMSFSVNQRRQEMGVRMALIRGAKQLSIGMVLGIGLGCLLAGPLSVVTFGVETTDVTAYAMIVRPNPHLTRERLHHGTLQRAHIWVLPASIHSAVLAIGKQYDRQVLTWHTHDERSGEAGVPKASFQSIGRVLPSECLVVPSGGEEPIDDVIGDECPVAVSTVVQQQFEKHAQVGRRGEEARMSSHTTKGMVRIPVVHLTCE